MAVTRKANEDPDQFILNHAQMKARPDATKHQVNNVKAWLFNNDHAIREDEASFIEAEGDLVPVFPKIKVPLRRLIERSDFMHLLRVNKVRRLSCNVTDLPH